MLALKRLKANLVKWLEISVRRHHLDQALCQLSPHMRGRVVEVGGGRIAHRGGFRPPTPMAAHGNNESPCWLTVDIAPDRSPHLQADAQSLKSAETNALRRHYKEIFEGDETLQEQYTDYTEMPDFEAEIDKLTAKYQDQFDELTAWETAIDAQITTASAELEEVNAYMESIKSMLSSNIQEDFNYGLNG